MRLLVITQAVDKDDPVLGFFHEWLEALAARVELLEVVCLREGKHCLPANVRVHSLGKERGVGRLAYLFTFYRYALSLRYDAVFVHMNEEYVLLAGLWWRLTGKRVVVWRNHKMGSWKTRLAARLSSTVCHTSPGAFVARYRKARKMPLGIDTRLFAPGEAPAPEGTLLFLGRLDPVKKAELLVDALEKVDLPLRADLYGNPTPGREGYAQAVAERAARVPSLRLHGSVAHAQAPELYRSHAVYCNLTPSGSFDKTIGEALSCGCLVVCANDAVREALPPGLFVEVLAAEPVARALSVALGLSPEARAEAGRTGRGWVEREHSLARLANELMSLLTL